MSASAALLPDGRLHLQHGPIDLLIRAWGAAAEVVAAGRQAVEAFPGILPELVGELAQLRRVVPATGPAPEPAGEIARAMHAAVRPYAAALITPMAAVAGAVADHVLAAMNAGRVLSRAYVNNGGDIAFHLAAGESLRAGLVSRLTDPGLDAIATLRADQPWRGLATSGRACKGQGGRSFSFGIADAVTVLAATAARADAAATVIANAVDLPGHPAIMRRRACDIDPDSDLGDRLITWDLRHLTEGEIAAALDGGRLVADALREAGLIGGAVLALRGRLAVSGPVLAQLEPR